MPKPLMMRWVLGVAAIMFAGLGIAFGWQMPSGIDRMAGGPAVANQGEFERRQGELAFLKAALDRLEAEARQDPESPAMRSLRAEQQAIVLRMREVARRMPEDSLPQELRGIAKDEPQAKDGPIVKDRPVTKDAPVAKDAPPTKDVPAAKDAPMAKDAAAAKDAPEPRPKDELRSASRPTLPAVPEPAIGSGTAARGELKTGFPSASPGPDLILARDPGLNLVILRPRQRTAPPTGSPTAEKPGETQAATADGKPATRPRTAERAVPKPPLSGSAGFADPRSEPTTAAR
jgi:hypothetical protein